MKPKIVEWARCLNEESAVAFRFFGLPIIFIFLLSSCAVGPDYMKPAVPEPTQWIEKENPKVKEEVADYSQWWTVFDDSTLDTLIEMAYQQNLPLQIAGLRILEARARLGIAIGNLYPQTQYGRGEVRYNELSKNQANAALSDRSYWDDSLGLDAAWELDIWGKFRRAVESNMANLDASIASYDDILVSLTADVAATYILIRTLEERLEVARENVKIQERSLQIADVRFRNGDVTELDVAQAKSLLRNTQAFIPRLEASLRQAKNALAFLLGTYPGEIDYLLGSPRLIPTAPPEVTVGIPAELLRRRPDIRLAERQLAAQSALIGVAKADLFPHFALFGSFGLRSSNSALTKTGNSSLGGLFDARSIEFFAGPSFEWDIFNYGRITNRVRVEDARFQQLAVNYENTVLRAVQEVEDGIIGFLRAQEEEGLLLESVDAAKRSVDLSLIQYREGMVSYQRVIDSQRFLTDQQDLLTSTKGTVANNLIVVYRALGGGWETRIGKDFVPVHIIEQMQKRTNWGGLLTPVKLEQIPADEKSHYIRLPEW